MKIMYKLVITGKEEYIQISEKEYQDVIARINNSLIEHEIIERQDFVNDVLYVTEKFGALKESTKKSLNVIDN